MNDPEVARLRRLRNTALLVRTIARELAQTRAGFGDALLLRAACASWRIVRAATGRLKAHPYARYQKEATVGSLLSNWLVAQQLALTTRRRLSMLSCTEVHLRQLMRQLDDVRALTLTPNLSDALGRSQIELESLVVAFQRETRGTQDLRAATPVVTQGSPELATQITEEWPYLAL